MTRPNSRLELIQWIRRELGEPVIDLNIADSQIDDRIDDAYDFWSRYHHAGTRREYLARKITQTETDERKLTLPENFISVTKVFPLSFSSGYNPDEELFNPQYQYTMSELFNMVDASLTGWVVSMQHFAMVSNLLNTEIQCRFSPAEGILFLDTDALRKDSYAIIEGFVKLSPEETPKVFRDDIFRRLAAAYSRRAWGRNLVKMEGIILPGGVTLDGSKLISEADKDIQQLEQDFILRFQAPDLFVVG